MIVEPPSRYVLVVTPSAALVRVMKPTEGLGYEC
jgi:hypothetical protein